MRTEQALDYEYDAPDGETPAASCPYCDRPFRTAQLATFHIGLRHADVCTAAERSQFEAARKDEEFDLLTFHVKTAASVFLLYFMFTFIYALVWAG